MTKKDYQAIADVIRAEVTRNGPIDSARRIAEGLAIILATDNPRFDRNRFLAACGFNP